MHSLETGTLVEELAGEAGLGEAAIVVLPLDPGSRLFAGGVARRSERAIYPASTIKVPIAAVLAAFWESGRLARRDPVVVSPANVTANDCESPLLAGYQTSLEELGRLMLTRSDNVATNVLIDVLGRDVITRMSQSWGLRATAVRRKLSGGDPLIDDSQADGRNAHSAADSARLYAMIGYGVHWAEPWLTETLLDQQWNEKLSRGLRAGDRFAHKTGDTSEVSHDGGIVFTPQGTRFVVVVHTELPSSPENDVRFGAFMSSLRPLLD